jgi:hypothetical protein
MSSDALWVWPKGPLSLAARLATGTPENDFEIDEKQTYAEVCRIFEKLT